MLALHCIRNVMLIPGKNNMRQESATVVLNINNLKKNMKTKKKVANVLNALLILKTRL